MRRSRSLFESFHNAASGFWIVFSSQRNLRIHLTAAFAVISLARAVRMETTSQAIIILTVALVITFEIINTAIEDAVDLAVSGFHPKARRAKDVAAGAVLFSAAASVAIGIWLFEPYRRALAAFLFSGDGLWWWAVSVSLLVVALAMPHR